MSFSIQSITISISRLDQKLKPFANRPIDINDPSWAQKVASAPYPLEQTGIRAEAQSVLAEILDAYAVGPEELRNSIRALLAKYSSFAWAAQVEAPMTTPDGFRKHLLRLSAVDQAVDFRDTILLIQDLCERADSAGVDVSPALTEVASISSDVSTGNMGSMRDVLLAVRSSLAAARGP
jgi:hypothetical protein